MRSFIESQFCSKKSKGLDARVRIEWNDGQICFQIQDEQISFADDANPELIIYFKDQDDVKSLILGEKDPMQAFMAGSLRANGHLIWVFQTMAALSGNADKAA